MYLGLKSSQRYYFFPKKRYFWDKIVEMLSGEYIKASAVAAGFDLCGVTRSRFFGDNERYFRRWLDGGFSAGMDYLHRNLDKRFDPSALVDGAAAVVVCAVNCKNSISDGYAEGSRTKIASYACAQDYHKVIKKMLRRLFSMLAGRYPELSGRAFVDSAPLLEKQLAVDAGLGWIGRQSLLVTPQYGTYVLLGELVLTDECDRYDSALEGCGCGECRRCIEACPAGALLPDHSVDASRCISCATVENAAGDTAGLHGWIFGCDECAACCPRNRCTPYGSCDGLQPLFDPRGLSSDYWLSLDSETFRERFGATPLMRSGLDNIRRNVLKNL